MELTSRRHTVADLSGAMELLLYQRLDGRFPGRPADRGAHRRRCSRRRGSSRHTSAPSSRTAQISVTAEKVAINAVMAGCKAEYLPVVVAAVEALGDPLYGYHGPATSTGGSAVFMCVNGPIANELGMNSGDNLFGRAGARTRPSDGRCGSSCATSIGTLPGELDRSSLGHGGKYTFCIAENEEDSPWPPFHTTRGFRRTRTR